MINLIKESLWGQFGAAIDMLRDALTLCPDDLFASNKKFFYIAYHTVIFLDYYMTNPPGSFSPLLPFTIREAGDIPEEALDDIIPDNMYSKEDLLGYLRSSREKAQGLIAGLTEENIGHRWKEEDVSPPVMNYSTLEILIYNMRHVQHHTAQLNLMLRQEVNAAPGWIGRTEV
ncbi:MAG: DinB family protein [Bacteroidetes bacterium]|nr:DinB family protein [Bacteroidota bacterium]